jgi:hypothetical protein
MITSPLFATEELTKFARSLCVDSVSSTTLTRQYCEMLAVIDDLFSGALGAWIPTTSTVEP